MRASQQGDDPQPTMVSSATFDELILMAQGQDSSETDYLHQLVGQTVSRWTSVESMIDTLTSYILNPANQKHGMKALKGLQPFAKVKLLESLLDPEWPDGALLIAWIERARLFRNNLAHGTVQTAHVEEDKVVHSWSFRKRKKNRKGEWTEFNQPVTASEFEAMLQAMRVLHSVMWRHLETRVYMHLFRMVPAFHLSFVDEYDRRKGSDFPETAEWFRPALVSMFSAPQSP
jgi:hypothetical protein